MRLRGDPGRRVRIRIANNQRLTFRKFMSQVSSVKEDYTRQCQILNVTLLHGRDGRSHYMSQDQNGSDGTITRHLPEQAFFLQTPLVDMLSATNNKGW